MLTIPLVPAMFCLYTSSKLSCQKFEFSLKEINGIEFRLPFKIFSTLRNVWVTTLLLCFWKNLLISSKKMASMLLVCLHAITCLIIPLSTTQAGDYSILIALSFCRYQNVLGWSKFFVPDQKFIFILWQSQTFCARQKDDLRSVKLFFVSSQKLLKRH